MPKSGPQGSAHSPEWVRIRHKSEAATAGIKPHTRAHTHTGKYTHTGRGHTCILLSTGVYIHR